ncbi:RsmB/NOP family class I SAM-dependent RNA methyltransferase [bacterium]|nr:RsmB/NOP family class I SAM-dependent RNA methyltransferase [bacterium]
MDNSNRYRNQIRNLEHILANLQDPLRSGQPVDKGLTSFFRRNKQYGSHDRRFISNAIFAYYRWYGWLRHLPSAEKGVALLLGYLLDGNSIDDRVVFWAEYAELSGTWLETNNFRDAKTLEEKAAILSRIIGPVQISALNPEFVEDWSIERLTAFQTRANIWLRVEQSDIQPFLEFLTLNHIDYYVHSQNPKSLAVLSPLNLNLAADYQKGWIEIQDLSSQAVGLICDPKDKEVWWDVCAGSGGKALHLSALMGTGGQIYATDVNGSMVRELNRRVRKNKRWSNILPVQWDGLRLPEFQQQLDGVLIDAPCSCSGTWRRNPELRWRLTREQVKDNARVQLSLLHRCCGSVRTNGVLIYATCSLLPEENEMVINAFLDSHKEFSFEKIRNPFSQEFSEKGLTISPPQTDGNGMYIARLRKHG